MTLRQTKLPRLWLFTDERAGGSLEAALGRLPRGAGIVFRHHATPPAARRALFERVRRIARARGLVLVLAASPRDAVGWRADGAHGRSPQRGSARALVRTAPAHGARELIAARRAHVDLIFVSPVFPTRSHPAAAALGISRFGMLRHRSRLPVAALGGMNPARFRALSGLAYGWGAIDAWSVDQKR